MTVKDVLQFFREVRLELSKVIWPKFDEWIGSTLVVLFLVAVFAVYLSSVDRVLAWLAGQVLKLYS